MPESWSSSTWRPAITRLTRTAWRRVTAFWQDTPMPPSMVSASGTMRFTPSTEYSPARSNEGGTTVNYEPLPQRVLMGPGPSNVNARVLQAMALPTIGHLDPAFTVLMDETMELLRGVFGTRNMLTFPVSGTGSAGMEACFVNVLQPGDRVLVGVNGVFGERMCDVARRCGALVTRIEAPWGSALDPEAVRRTAKEVRPRVMAFVHAETSTG